MSTATDRQRQTTSCEERRLCDACVMKYLGLIRAASSAATGNHINRGCFSFCGSAPSRSGGPRFINRDLQEDQVTIDAESWPKFPYP